MLERKEKSIVILYEIEHIEAVISYFGITELKEGNRLTLVPIDYEVELRLRSISIPFFSMKDYVSRSSLKERLIFVANLAKKFFKKPEMDFFEYSGIKLGRIIDYSLSEYLLRVLYYLDIFAFILDRFGDGYIIYMPKSAKIISKTVGQLAVFEVAAPVKIMSFLAKNGNFKIKIIPCESKKIMKNKLRVYVKSYLRSVFLLLLKALNKMIYLFRSDTNMKIFVSDYWWHIDYFMTKMDNIEITMMDRKEIKNAKKYVWKYKMMFSHIGDYITFSGRKNARIKNEYCRERWQLLCEKPDFSREFFWYGVNFWEIVEPAYSHLIGSFSLKIMEAIEGAKELLKKQKINAAILRASISGQIHFPVLGLVAQKMNIPAIELQHGLECLKLFSLSAEKCANIIASYGPLIKEELDDVNVAPLRVFETGSPRFDQYRKEIIKEDDKNNLSKKLGIYPSRPVLLYIATDIVFGQTHDTYSMLRVFNNLVSLLRKDKELQIIIKIRPGPFQEYFFKKSLKEIFNEKCIIAQYEDMHELLSISDVVLSSYSTVVLEAMILKKPVILVGVDTNERMLMESHFLPYEKAGALKIARTEDDLFFFVRELLSHEGSKKVIKMANNFLDNNFSFDGLSANRMVKLLNSLRK